MLTILEQKTRGNLTGEEESLLHQVLFDLRVRYKQSESNFNLQASRNNFV